MESGYHLQSLAVTTVIVSTFALLCLAPAVFGFPHEFRDSLRSWTLGTALIVLADVLFVVDLPIPLGASVLTAIVGIGTAEWLHALRLSDGQPRRLRWPYVLAAAAFVLSTQAQSYRASSVISSVCLAVLYVAGAWSASRIREPRVSASRRVLIGVFVVIALVMAARLGLTLSGLRSGAAPGFTTFVRALLFVLASMGPIAGSLAFVLMCGDRLGDQLWRLAAFDPLTGIRNRRTFLEAVDRALAVAARRSEPVAMIGIDVDHFKTINDAHGHPVGDRALTALAQVLASGLRVGDEVGRLGGEEFAVLMPRTDEAAALAAA
jgi:hypothetical protein